MTDIDVLEGLINKDPEFKELVEKANKITDTAWVDNAPGILDAKSSYVKFADQSIEQFFATYKTIVAWAVLMGSILHKIHSNNDSDVLSGHKFYFNNKQHTYVLCSPTPVPFTLKCYLYDSGVPYFMLWLSVWDLSKSNFPVEPLTIQARAFDGWIKFKLTDIAEKCDSAGNYYSDPLNSGMTVLIADNSQHPIYKQEIHISEFVPDKLLKIIKQVLELKLK